MATKKAKPSISIIVPTYNEKGNIEKLIPEIFASCKGLNAKVEVIVADDKSPDGTGKLAEELAKRHNVKVLHRSEKKGLAAAVIHGFSESKSQIIGVMDADLSHPPHILPKLIRPLLNNEAELVIGSRYIKGGGVEVWPIHRRMTSKLATLMAWPLTKVHDPMSGLFFLKRSALEGTKLNAKGYKIGLEVLVKGNYKKVLEIPYTFRNRFVGKSKLTPTEYIHYLRNLIVLAAYKLTHPEKKKEYLQRQRPAA